MSNKSLEIALALKLQDQASSALRRAMGGIEDSTKRASKHFDELTKKTNLFERALKGAHVTAMGLAKLTAGGMAANSVIAPTVSRTMDYSMRLAHMANTAFKDRDTAGRIAGKRELDAAVDMAVRKGGGTREDAALALDAIIASGAVSAKTSMGMLPAVQRAAVGANADPLEMAMIGVRANQSFGIKEDRMAHVFDMALTAGQEGGFEVKDMAHWLPQQMASAGLSGMKGEAGLAKLLAANQASAITAGTKDEAGNNLVNLLAKLNAPDTQHDAKKLGINLAGTLAASAAKGQDPIDAFVALVDRIAKSNKEYGALRKKIQTAKDENKKSLLESQAAILQGTAIGKLVQDRQALGALVGIMNNRKYMEGISEKSMSAGDAVGANQTVLNSEAGFAAQKLAQEKAIAEQKGLSGVNDALGETARKLIDYAQKYPDLTANLTLATTALSALAAAAGAAGVVGLLMGGKGAAGAGALAAGGVAGSRLRPLLGLLGGQSLRTLGMFGSGAVAAGAAGVGLAGGVGYGAGWLTHKAIEGTQADNAIGEMVAKALAAMGNEEAKRSLKVTVDVKNGNIVAAVNQAAAKEGRRK